MQFIFAKLQQILKIFPTITLSIMIVLNNYPVKKNNYLKYNYKLYK